LAAAALVNLCAELRDVGAADKWRSPLRRMIALLPASCAAATFAAIAPWAASAIGSWGSFGTSPWAFVICVGFIFLTWGEIFDLFPSTCTDTFGTKFCLCRSQTS
jgi:hypothetical protein